MGPKIQAAATHSTATSPKLNMAGVGCGSEEGAACGAGAGPLDSVKLVAGSGGGGGNWQRPRGLACRHRNWAATLHTRLHRQLLLGGPGADLLGGGALGRLHAAALLPISQAWAQKHRQPSGDAL